MFTLAEGRHFSVLRVCLPKATALRQATRAVCENQLISSHLFTEKERIKHRTKENQLRTPVDEKRRTEKDRKH